MKIELSDIREIVKRRDEVFKAMGYTPRPLNAPEEIGTISHATDALEERARAARERLIRR